MSTLKAEVVEVDVEAHPNADRLDITRPRGKAWQCVCQKDSFKTGDLAVYLPIDSVLPEPLVEKLGIANYYSKRLRTVKLRGFISQGMCAPLDIIPEFIHEVDGGGVKGIYDRKDLKPGHDVTEVLGIIKYDPPIPIEMSGKVREHDGRFVRYTDIENYKNYPDVFKDGELVVITEKLHGTNGRAANIEGDIHVGSHRQDLVEVDTNLYWRGATLLNVKEKLQPGEQVFFEVFGHGVQDLRYGKKPGEISVGVFGLMVNGKYLDEADFVDALDSKGWGQLRVPVLHMGPWSKDLLSLADGKSAISDDTIREGFVITPAVETDDVALQGRKILKVISDKYLVRKDATERH